MPSGDHDFGPNYQRYSGFIRIGRGGIRGLWPNPDSGIPAAKELNTTHFMYGDVEIFLLDNRSHRVNHEMGPEKRQVLGEAR